METKNSAYIFFKPIIVNKNGNNFIYTNRMSYIS